MKNYSARFLIYGILHDAITALNACNDSRQVYDNLLRRLKRLDLMNETKYMRIEWNK